MIAAATPRCCGGWEVNMDFRSGRRIRSGWMAHRSAARGSGTRCAPAGSQTPAGRLHDELTFSSVGDLIRQIDADVAAVPQALAEAEQLTGLGPPASGSVEQTTAGRSQTRSPKRETR